MSSFFNAWLILKEHSCKISRLNGILEITPMFIRLAQMEWKHKMKLSNEITFFDIHWEQPRPRHLQKTEGVGLLREKAEHAFTLWHLWKVEKRKSRPPPMSRTWGNHINQSIICIVKEKALALSSQPIYSCHDSTAQDLSSVTYPCHVCGRDLACLGEGVGWEGWGEVLWVGKRGN